MNIMVETEKNISGALIFTEGTQAFTYLVDSISGKRVKHYVGYVVEVGIEETW